ncbi:histidine kinase [Paenibacillus sp. MMS20-IR301]|uniref:sensor histidine kinase n=1 Tax=Paenibacillus sp. MMS20-IR301 TaxID=2895946 RepID=UPI0028ED2B22|nr:histidine kinase [Paenibacillus sp. MMS20-IR301]WNS40816.1 histidine kinase [Paenibacillus sp. MMS20-IR301]
MNTFKDLLRLKFKFPKIRSRFFAVMILVSLPPLFLLGYISLNITKDTLVKNHILTNQDHLKTSSEVADLLLGNIINMNRIILENSDIREAVRQSGNLIEQESTVLDIQTANLLQNIVVSNLFDLQNIESVCLFDRNFHSVCYGRSENAGKYGSEDTKGQIAVTDWYLKALAANGKEVFFGFDVLENDSSGAAFSSVKLLRDPDRLSGQSIGLLVINIKNSIFRQSINESDTSNFIVLDNHPDKAHSQIIYDLKPEITAKIGITNVDDNSSILSKLTDNGYIYSQYLNRTSGWTFVHFISTKTLMEQPQQITTVTMLIAVLIAMVALVVSFVVSGTITKPLLLLKRMISDWAKGNPSTRPNETFEADEVGVIGEAFRRVTAEYELLSERLLQSQLKEKEAELRSLQAQIKPHFLYNTLDSIYWMSMLEEKEDIAQMALSLSESFKLSLNKGKDTIPVFKELKHIEHYLIIQNLRFDNRFTYLPNIEPEVMGFEIMKLLLQPLVENAIYHGLEPKVGKGTITLTGKKDGEYLVFTVTDDGVGIKDIQKTEQGYGMRNVQERLQIYYGPASSFSIISQPGAGTTIELRFPYAMLKEE